MGKNEKTILLATILALSLSVTVGVVLAWDVNHADWGAYGGYSSRCLAGAAGNVASGNFYQYQHWAGWEGPSPLQPYAEVYSTTNYPWVCKTYARTWVKINGQYQIDSYSYIWIYPDDGYYANGVYYPPP